MQEVFLFAYFAGHGCADYRQYYLLNEKEVDKIFWPVEADLRTLLRVCGHTCKLFVVYDCCRENYHAARLRVKEKIESTLEK